MLFVQGYVLSHFALGYEPPDAGPTRFGQLFADFQMLLGEAQDIGLRSGELGRDRDLLHSRKREGGKFLSTASTCAAGAMPEVTARSCTSTGRWMLRTADA